MLNDSIVAAIKYYLERPTDYAVMLDGAWGSGKTHYFKKHIAPIISATSLSANNPTKYKPVYISLYGLKSAKEVQTQIFYTLYPFLTKKPIKYGLKIFGAVANSFLKSEDENFESLFSELISVSDTAINEGDMIKQTPLVICLDDIERREESFTLNEFFGLINSWNQEIGAKVIIIANEEKDASSQDLKKIKEKVIGATFKFEPNKQSIIEEIINDRYANHSLEYKEFLKVQRAIIIDTFSSNCGNFRTLIFGLNYFYDVYNRLTSTINDNDKLNKPLQFLLKFTLAVAIEYREGRLTSDTLQNITERYIRSDALNKFIQKKNLKQSNVADEKEVDNSIGDDFAQRYFDGLPFKAFESVGYFVTTSNVEYLNRLYDEVVEKYPDLFPKNLPQNIAIYNTLLNDAHKLSDEIYYKNVRLLLSELQAGSFQNLSYYIGGFSLILRYGNPLGYSISWLTSRVLSGMRKASINESLSLYDHDFSDEPEEIRAAKTVIVNEMMSINDKILKRSLKDRATLIQRRLEENDFAGIKNYLLELDSLPGVGEFKYLNTKRIISMIKKNTNQFVLDFDEMLWFKYKHDLHASIYTEKEFLTSLLNGLNNVKVGLRKKRYVKRLMGTIETLLVKYT